MTWTTSKNNQSANAYPRTLSWIAVSFGGLALFLALGCLILVSNPVSSTVRGYFYTVDSSERLDVSLSSNNPAVEFPQVDNINKEVSDESISRDPTSQSSPTLPSDTKELETVAETAESEDQVAVPVVSTGSSIGDNLEAVDEKLSDTEGVKEPAISGSQLGDDVKDVTFLSNTTDDIQSGDTLGRDDVKNVAFPSNTTNDFQSSEALGTKDIDIGTASFGSNIGDKPPSYASKDDSGCDLYQGKWVYDSKGPLYTNNTCPVLTQMQNCQGNGRPDKDYENWRWQPEKCDLPRFNARKFLELMRRKTIAFIGDSVARNQMESLLCILWQEEVPKNRGNKKMQRYYFKSTSTMVVRIWSSWLVKHTTEPADLAPGVVKLHLDAPDETIMENLLSFDVIVLSSGHWFAKQSVYLLNNETVGGQLWWPDKSRPMKVNNVKAFGISVETIVAALATHPSFAGLTIVRSFSPDHYEGGAWNTGGSCTGKTEPLKPGRVVENGFTNVMHEEQVSGFKRAVERATANKSRTRLMDITRVFEYRHDGHPGPFRSMDPNKLTKRGPDGKPPPQDCLHWCMPGPVDTWNELVLELVRREFENSTSSSL